MVDVRDDAEVPDNAHVGMTGTGRWLRTIRKNLLGHCWHRKSAWFVLGFGVFHGRMGEPVPQTRPHQF
jgi:hypothetical protein